MFVVIRVNLTPSWWRCLSTAAEIATGAGIALAIAAASAAGLISLSGIEWFGPIVLATILITSAIKLLRSANRTEPTQPVPREEMGSRLFGLGLATALSNPLTVPFFAAFYIATPDARTTLGVLSGALTISFMAFSWFAAVGRMASHPFVRSRGARQSVILKYTLAAIMIIFASMVLKSHFNAVLDSFI